MRHLLPALIASLTIAGLGAPAHAALITQTFDFVGSDFVTTIGPDAPPLGSVDLSFTVTFDPTQAYSNSTANITLDSSSLPLGSAFAFSYFPELTQRMVVGGSANGPLGITVGANDFTLDINGAAGLTPTPTFFQFTTAASGDSVFRANTRAITVSAAVPEPSSWALMIAGFALLGGGLRRYRANVVHA